LLYPRLEENNNAAKRHEILQVMEWKIELTIWHMDAIIAGSPGTIEQWNHGTICASIPVRMKYETKHE